MKAYPLRRIPQRSVARQVKYTIPCSDRESPEQRDEEPDHEDSALHQRQTTGDSTHALQLSDFPRSLKRKGGGSAEALPQPSRPHLLRTPPRSEE